MGLSLVFFLINNQIRQIFFKVEVTYLFTNILCFCFNLFPVKIYFRLSRFPQAIPARKAGRLSADPHLLSSPLTSVPQSHLHLCNRTPTVPVLIISLEESIDLHLQLFALSHFPALADTPWEPKDNSWNRKLVD